MPNSAERTWQTPTATALNRTGLDEVAEILARRDETESLASSHLSRHLQRSGW